MRKRWEIFQNKMNAIEDEKQRLLGIKIKKEKIFQEH